MNGIVLFDNKRHVSTVILTNITYSCPPVRLRRTNDLPGQPTILSVRATMTGLGVMTQ